MPCIFCDGVNHRSTRCETYSTFKSRDDIIATKNLCRTCFLPLNNLDHCKNVTKCYICFSTKHRSDSCPEKPLQMMLPKIDQTLLERFYKMLSVEEQYFMAIANPDVSFKFIKPIVINNSVHTTGFLKGYEECNFLFNGYITIRESDLYERMCNPFNQNSFIFKVRDISLHSIQEFSVELFCKLLTPFTERLSCECITISENAKCEEYLRKYNHNLQTLKIRDISLQNTKEFPSELLCQLLNPFTKTLTCRSVKLDTKIRFSDMLQRMPSIENIDIRETNIKIDKTWPKDLLKYIAGNNFRKLIIQSKIFVFKFSAVAEFMKTKMCPDGFINFHTDIRRFADNRSRFERSLTKYFLQQDESAERNCPMLRITNMGDMMYLDTERLVCK